MYVASWCCKSFCVVPCASFCTGHFVMVPLNTTYLHCLQHSLFEHLFNFLLTSLANYDEQITLVSHFVYFFSWLQTPYLHFLLVPWNSLIPTEEWSHDNQYVVPVLFAGWLLICRWLFITVACKKVNLQINKSRNKLLCGIHIPVQAIT